MKIQTEAVHFSADEQLLNDVKQKVSKLKFFFNRISEARVILKLDESHRKKASVAEVKVYLPHGIMYIKENCKTFEGALGKAIVGLKVQLMRHKTKSPSYCLI